MAGKRTDVINHYVANGWPASNPEAIFRNWWAGTISPTDPAKQYGSLEAYAAALGCGSTTGDTGSGTGALPGESVTQKLWRYMEKEPALAIAGIGFLLLTMRRLYRSE